MEFRTFFYSLFGENPLKRRRILKNWYSEYSGTLYNLITSILYEPVRFRVHTDHFLLLGDASKCLAIRYTWLDARDKQFIVEQVINKRKELFKTCVVGENNHMRLDGFKYNPESRILSPVDWKVNLAESHTGIFSFVWQRELVRDLVWLVLHKSKNDAYLRNQLILDLRRINDEHIYGRRDLFISTLLQGIYGQLDVYKVPCWGFSKVDIHPEDAYQRENFAITTPIY